MIQEKIIHASAALIDAFTGNSGLKDALDELAAASGARGAAIMPLNMADRERASSDALEAGMDAYDKSWAYRDFRRAAVPKMFADGIAVDQDIVTADGMRRLAFYTDYLASFGFRWFAGIPIRSGDEAWCLAIQRTPDQGPFEREEQDILRQFGATISTAAPAARMIATARISGILEGLDAAGAPALLLDRKGQVLQIAHTVTDEILFELGVKLGSPLFSAPNAIAELISHIDAVSAGPGSPPRGPLIIRRAENRPLFLSFRRVNPEGARYFSKASVLVLIDDPDRRCATAPQTLMRAFDLTPAQARVALAIGEGCSIKSCAERLGVGTETVRTAVQKIFAKMGVSRQSELVGVLARLRF